ncbi:hypothetical protein Prum_006350 [Phytohabitans rumicis]|uniref:AAA+ ATPase domain-containing protein n=2 Tax=Phytohabitans rumicis TaxID=1076125 RepID=A0A6V8KP95_9ACTN|nr:hypothetical protein Prum_006350 [Phytohabitans rumicis]
MDRLGSPHLVRGSDVETALALTAPGSVGPGGLMIAGGPGAGKSALARRVLERLHSDGWAVAVLAGRWYPVDLFAAAAKALDAWAGDFPQRGDASEILDGGAPHCAKFQTIQELLKQAPFALLFDDFDRNLGSEGYLDPGFAEAFDRLCGSAGRGRMLVTSRVAPPPSAATDRLRPLRLTPADETVGAELAASLPYLSTLDSTTRQRVAAVVAGHPRSLQLVDAWLGAARVDPAERLAAVLSHTASPSGAALLELVMAELSAAQREMLLQTALATFPLTARDVAVACDASDPSLEQRQSPERAAVDAAAEGMARLAELGLVKAWTDTDGDTVVLADRWVAEGLAPHQGEQLAARHERALNMHYAETHSDRRTYDDYVAVTRHLAAVDGMGDLTKFTLDLTKYREGDYSAMALLGEVIPTVPAGNGHYLPLRERQITTLIRGGYMTAAREAGKRTLRAVTGWAATHPQRDEARFCLGAAHNLYGVALLHGGDLAAAEPIFTATVEIYHELGAEHPTSFEAQRRLGYALEHLGEVYLGLNRPQDEDILYKTLAECVFVRTQLFEADPSPDTALMAGPSMQRLADLAERTGDHDNARSLLRTRLAMVEAIAQAYPDDEDLAEELAAARDRLATLTAAPAGE